MGTKTALTQDKVLGSEQARSMAESITVRMDGFIGPQCYTFVQTDILISCRLSKDTGITRIL